MSVTFESDKQRLKGSLRYPGGGSFKIEKPLAEFKHEATREGIQQFRVMLWTLAGGGMIADSFVNQPESAYIDARVGGLPVTRIYNARAVYLALLAAGGFKPTDFPPVRVPYSGWLL